MHRDLLGFFLISVLVAPATAEAEQTEPVVVPLAGPYPSLHHYCQSIARTACAAKSAAEYEDQAFSCNPAMPGTRLKNPAEPYRQVRLFSTGCLFNPELGHGRHYYRLAVQTAEGWFASEPIADRWMTKHCDADTRAREFAFRDIIPGGAPEVVLRLSVDEDCGSWDESNEPAEHWLMVAGIGPSGKPSATRAIPLNEAALPRVGNKRRTSRHKSPISVTWKADGSLQLGSGSVESPADPVPNGTYRLTFP